MLFYIISATFVATTTVSLPIIYRVDDLSTRADFAGVLKGDKI
jgi:hypothetical protein